MDELVTRIKNTVYLDAFAKLVKPYTAEKIEGALREYLVNSHAKMVNITGGCRNSKCLFCQICYLEFKNSFEGKGSGEILRGIIA